MVLFLAAEVHLLRVREFVHLRHQQCGLIVLSLNEVHLLLVLSPHLATLIGVVPKDVAVKAFYLCLVAAAS